jgi:MFS transporter, DHA1 family, staphyloferrin A biosynthesis exporter
LKSSQKRNNILISFGLTTFNSLQAPGYRLYFFGMLGQFAAVNMQMIANSLLIYRLTGSSALLGTMSLASAIPTLILSLFGGAIADRVQKKRVLIISLVCSAIISFGTATALYLGIISKENAGSWWILILISVLQGTILGITMPARQAIIPELVSHDQAMNAVALNMLGMNVLSLAAPAVAGFLVDAFDFKAVFFTMGGLNVYAITFMLFIRHTSPINKHSSNIMNDIKKGFLYIRQDRTIFLVLIFTLMVVVLSMPYQQLLPIYVDDILHVGATGLGVLSSVSGAGALVGSLLMAALPGKKRGLFLLAGGLVSALALIAFAFSSVWSLSLVFIVFVGLGSTIRGTVSSALLQSYTEPGYMGRVMSIFMMQWGIVSLCTFMAGMLAEVFPVQWVVGGFAIALLAVTVFSYIFSPRLRKLD